MHCMTNLIVKKIFLQKESECIKIVSLHLNLLFEMLALRHTIS